MTDEDGLYRLEVPAGETTGSGNSVAITDDPENLNKRGQWAGLVLSGSFSGSFQEGFVVENLDEGT